MHSHTISSVLVKPTSADCNLDCTYCFYAPKLALYPETKVHRMSEEVLAELISQLMDMSDQQAAFSWQGGEPTLMGLDFFEKVVSFQQKFGGPGQLVGNSLQTNATLIDRDWARFLKRYNFLVGASLDGPKELHDFYRTSRGGEPSYDRVMKGIGFLEHFKVEFNILVLLNRMNVEKPRELYGFFVSHGFGFLQFIPCIEKDPATGKAADYSITPEQYGRFFCELFDLWTKDGLPTIYIRDFEDLVISYVTGQATSCIFSEECGSYVVVEYNGDVYACDFFVDREWLLGNLMERPIKELVQTEKFNEFRSRKSRLCDECKNCQWLFVCRGACPKHRTVLGGDASEPSYFCPAYKMFFEHSHERFLELRRVVVERERRQAQAAALGPAVIHPGVQSAPPTPSIKSAPTTAGGRKVSRNAPCPCGSGRKYKHCCGR